MSLLDSILNSSWTSIRLFLVVSFVKVAQNSAVSQQITAVSHIAFVPPREMIISSKVKAAISEISQLKATALAAAGTLIWAGNTSPRSDQEIGPRPRLNAANKSVIHVGVIQK